jgi:hypothetical protein
VLKLIPHNLHLLLAVNPLPVVLPRHQAVHLPHQVRSLHQAVHLPPGLHRPEQHKLLLTIQQVLRLQINLLLKVVAVASPKQVKLKQPATVVEVKQDLV